MSFNKARTSVGSLISGKPKSEFSYEVLRKAGLQVVSSERVSERIQWQKDFNAKIAEKPKKDSSPEEMFEFYVTQLDTVWGMYKANQMAWFRAGSNGPFGEMVTSIEVMHEKTSIAIERNRHILEKLNDCIVNASKSQDIDKTKTDEEIKKEKLRSEAIVKKLKNKKEQLVRNFYVAWLVMLMFKYISAQGNLCWNLEDVNPPETYGIQTVQPIQQSYPPTTNEHPKDLGTPKPTANWGKPKYTTPVNDEAEEPQQ